MYDLPSLESVAKVVIDEGVINEESKPILIYQKKDGGKKKVAEQ